MTVILLALLASACASRSDIEHRAPAVDLSPLGCGYTWSQSGHAEMACDTTMEEARKKALAIADAWRIARARCPTDCPPQELRDTSAGPEREHAGVCYGGVTYFPQRILVRCGTR